MKFLLCVCFLPIIIVEITALTADQTRKMNKISTQCKSHTGVSEEVILNARNGIFVDDPKLKKQILCVAKNVGLASDSGEINIGVLKRQVKKVAKNDEEADSIVNTCVVEKNTPEDTAFAIVKCILKEKPDFSPIE